MIHEILTEEQLCMIAGHWTRGGLKSWLEQQSIPFLLARSGWPRVHRKALEAAMGVRTDEAIKEPVAEFNFDSLR